MASGRRFLMQLLRVPCTTRYGQLTYDGRRAWVRAPYKAMSAALYQLVCMKERTGCLTVQMTCLQSVLATLPFTKSSMSVAYT